MNDCNGKGKKTKYMSHHELIANDVNQSKDLIDIVK